MLCNKNMERIQWKCMLFALNERCNTYNDTSFLFVIIEKCIDVQQFGWVKININGAMEF